MTPAGTARPRKPRNRAAVVLTLALLLAACTIPEARMGTADRLPIFGDAMRFPDMGLPADWFAEGISPALLRRRHFDVSRDKDMLVATLMPAEKSFVTGRRVFAPLAPHLRLAWRWKIREAEPGGHPLRIAVGFHGGAPGSRSRGGQPFVFLGTAIPVHDRMMLLVWAERYDARGRLDAARPVPRYAVRGGDSEAGGWIEESVDLADLYARAWPKDDVARAAVTFVAFSAAARPDDGKTPSDTGKFADVVLMR
jgi:hypothetical protein